MLFVDYQLEMSIVYTVLFYVPDSMAMDKILMIMFIVMAHTDCTGDDPGPVPCVVLSAYYFMGLLAVVSGASATAALSPALSSAARHHCVPSCPPTSDYEAAVVAPAASCAELLGRLATLRPACNTRQ